jgi:hypothetical protein
MTASISRRAATASLLATCLLATCLLAACLTGGTAHAQTSARPARVLVVDATASPAVVQLDPSPGMQAQRAAAGVTPAQAAAADILAVQTALSDTLVQKITAMGLQAVRMPAGSQPAPGELAVTIQITAIQEGNRARRTVIGLGAGKVSVQGIATLLQGTSAGPEVLQTYTSNASSGRMPGLGIGAAASGVKSATTAASGAAHGASELDNPVAEEATKAANRLAANLGQYFAVQNWISPSAVPGNPL